MADGLEVAIVQQGAWVAPRPTMPLAAGYLKAAALADAEVVANASIRIVDLPGGIDVREAAVRLLSSRPPDVLAFSVLGWNQRSFGELARTYKQVRPDGLVVFGGNHVSHQGEVVFTRWPDVDVVVNGEGEATFTELLRWRIRCGDEAALADVAGISFVRGSAARRAGLSSPKVVVTTAERTRRSDLDALPSPLLTGAIPLKDHEGRFPYDVALMETNRGCPYRCSFCYWGGAVGARVHEFSRERLHAELELLGRHGVDSVVLCDANFGMRRADLDFVEDLIEVRNRLGAPRYLEASWTKNKSETFYEIVRLMKAEGLTSSFTLALQSLDGPTLTSMARRNMQINDWRDVVTFLRSEGLDCYAELIWGAPGESPKSFFAGYDELARLVPRIAVYPLLLIPNTDYHDRRDELGIVTVRGADDDFEYVLAHNTMTAEENLEVQRVVFWARVLAENAVLRWCWWALALVPGREQSEVVRAFADHVDASEAPVAVALRSLFRPFSDSSSVAAAVRLLHERAAEVEPLLASWWEREVVASSPAAVRPFLRTVLAYDWATRPVYVAPGDEAPYAVEMLDGEEYYVLPPRTFEHDVAALLPVDGDLPAPPPPSPITVHFVAKVGFYDRVENHEVAVHHVGRPRRKP